jgi:hypothetical protein
MGAKPGRHREGVRATLQGTRRWSPDIVTLWWGSRRAISRGPEGAGEDAGAPRSAPTRRSLSAESCEGGEEGKSRDFHWLVRHDLSTRIIYGDSLSMADNSGERWYVRDHVAGQPRQVWRFVDQTAARAPYALPAAWVKRSCFIRITG